MSNPTLIFIHGSWHQPTCYDPIIKLIETQKNLKCIAITLPSTTGNPSATFKDDLDVAREAISNELDHERNVVVIAHSYGGMVGNSAIKGFTKSTTTQSKAHVIGLILIASGFTLTGLTFMDPFLGHPPPAWRVNRETGYAELVASPRELFYHDVPDEEAEYWVSQLTSQSLKALFEGGEHTYAGWKDVPSWYIGTTEDRGIPVLAQRMGVGMAREMGGVVEHREMETSHSPFLSQPQATVDIIVEAVEAFTGSQKSEPLSARRVDVPVPALPRAVLWQPSTWLKFGLPLAFGHVLGRGILVFGWGKRLWRSRFGLRSV
ncbi:alpha/beta-hydrolase [Penicillium brevicompactum]|uniref:Alpha/beta-hydrolase n=1 Tax=Penicillium brevicompactum TaxID=5074 RepID=A0A9W9V074_PENBR|nr:alpha/beta-hydrolase [Penicillium brevicompactum]